MAEDRKTSGPEEDFQVQYPVLIYPWVRAGPSKKCFLYSIFPAVQLSKLSHNRRSLQTWNIEIYYKMVFYLYVGWPVAQGRPSGKRPWGPGHRSADWACSGGGALSATAPGTHWAGVLCTAGQRYYVQTLVPGKCTCYPPGSSDRPPPGTQREGRQTGQGRVISDIRSVKNMSE